jgi:hypothetical protein
MRKTALILALATFTFNQDCFAANKVKSSVSSSVTFSCSDSEQQLVDKGVVRVKFGRRSIYIGYQQVSGNNKNPIMARFDKGVQAWCRTDFETSGDDGEGYGILWNGRKLLYAVFSATGTQGSVENDYRRFTSEGWLTSYGSGGGPRVTILSKINAQNGAPVAGTFVTALLSSGKTNTLNAVDLRYKRKKIVLKANSYYSPRKPDKSAFSCEGSSPFASVFHFNKKLTSLISAKADGCS